MVGDTQREVICIACYHPLKGFVIGLSDNGKKKLKITSYEAHHVELYSDNVWRVAFTPQHSPYSLRSVSEFIQIPCGKCLGCRLRYSRQWADRCMLELQYHESSYFVTLTYNDKNLPTSEWLDTETGECGTSHSLVKRDVQLFLKRLRRYYKYDNHLMYYCAGEYGSKSARPHYHLIIFGLRLDDLKVYKTNPDLKYSLFTSDFLDKCWNKGYVVVGLVNWDTCAYTARYIMKKQYGSSADVYEKLNIIPEFTTMSLKPAIGKRFFDEHGLEMFEKGVYNLSTESGSKKIFPPDYFIKKLEEIDEDLYEEEKLKRSQKALNNQILEQSLSDKDYLTRLSDKESSLKKRVSKLKRM